MLYEDIVRGVVNSTKSITFELMNNDDDNDESFLKGKLIIIPGITDIAAMVLHLNFSLICWEEISSDTSPKDTEALIWNVWRADVNSWTLHSTRLTAQQISVNRLISYIL